MCSGGAVAHFQEVACLRSKPKPKPTPKPHQVVFQGNGDPLEAAAVVIGTVDLVAQVRG